MREGKGNNYLVLVVLAMGKKRVSLSDIIAK